MSETLSPQLAELSEEQLQHLQVAKLHLLEDGSLAAFTCLLNVGGVGRVAVDCQDLASTFAQLAVVEHATFSHSRKMNTENHYQKYAGEEFFHSEGVSFMAIWRCFPPDLLAHPEIAQAVRAEFAKAFTEVASRTMRTVYRVVLSQVENRARQLRLEATPFFRRELAQMEFSGFDGFDPMHTLPKVDLPEGWTVEWSDEYQQVFFLNRHNPQEWTWERPTTPAKKPETVPAA